MKNTTTKTKKRKGDKTFQVINPNAAGIDIGSEVHYVAVPEDVCIIPHPGVSMNWGSVPKILFPKSINVPFPPYDLFKLLC